MRIFNYYSILHSSIVEILHKVFGDLKVKCGKAMHITVQNSWHDDMMLLPVFKADRTEFISRLDRRVFDTVTKLSVISSPLFDFDGAAVGPCPCFPWKNPLLLLSFFSILSSSFADFWRFLKSSKVSLIWDPKALLSSLLLSNANNLPLSTRLYAFNIPRWIDPREAFESMTD